MTVHAPFNPRRGVNQVITANSGSQSTSIDPIAKSVRFVNSGSSNIVHVRVGQGSQTATTADMPVIPGESIVVTKSEGDDTVAYISASGTTLHIQTGEGGFC